MGLASAVVRDVDNLPHFPPSIWRLLDSGGHFSLHSADRQSPQSLSLWNDPNLLESLGRLVWRSHFYVNVWSGSQRPSPGPLREKPVHLLPSPGVHGGCSRFHARSATSGSGLSRSEGRVLCEESRSVE